MSAGVWLVSGFRHNCYRTIFPGTLPCVTFTNRAIVNLRTENAWLVNVQTTKNITALLYALWQLWVEVAYIIRNLVHSTQLLYIIIHIHVYCIPYGAEWKRLCCHVQATRFLPERDYIMFGSLLSPIHLSSVCNVGARYSGGWTSRQCTLAIRWP